ncbi:MAG: ferrous iron transporter B [candidate division Zixibacteria bacterium]|nr:ferrous iron transporter B [candidate division Zixibacteria bacterium]
MKQILLMGNPNVGKSVIFSRLTGVKVITSNYPGTTVEFTRGHLKLGDEVVEVIDVPGTYTLEPNSPAEKVAVEMLHRAIPEKESIIIDIVDATNLERNLNLTLQLLKKDIPIIVALNLWDEAGHIGVSIDVEKLQRILGVPVVPTVAITGEGIKKLVETLPEARKGDYQFENAERWHEIGRIVEKVQVVKHRHHTFLERIGDLTVKPFTGIPSAILILYGTFRIVRLIGEGLINIFLDPLFKNYYLVAVTKAVETLLPGKFLHNLLLGTTPDPLGSFGVLTAGLYIPFVVVLPYLFSFYLALSFLEDWGYLPRLAVLLDNMFHRLGLHGYSSIPVILGLGCKVPALLSTRILETQREKIIAIALILMIAPCMPQTAMIVSIVTPYGGNYLILIFSLLFVIGITASFLLNKLLKGEAPELLIEIPPYRVPKLSILFKKVWFRLSSFITSAVPLIILGIFLIGLLDLSGVISFASRILGAPLLFILGLPPETVFVLITGFLRKDISIALLQPLHLPPKSLVIACIFLVLYLPCISTFFVMSKELGLKNSLKLVAILFILGLLVGGTLNLIFKILRF